MDIELHDTVTQGYGSKLVQAIEREFYKLCYPKQSVSIPLEDRKLGSQQYIKQKAIAVLESMRIDENRLDVITVAEAIYNQRWADDQRKEHFQSLSRFKQQEYVEIADRMVQLVLSGDYHA